MEREQENSLFTEDLSEMMGDISEMIGPENENPDGSDENNQNNENIEQPSADPENENNLDINLDGEEEQEDESDSTEDNENPDGEGANYSEDEDNENTDDTDESSSLTPYAKLLVDEGILPNLDLEKFDGSPEGLIEAARNEVTNGIEYYKESLPQDVKNLINGYEAGVPFEKLLEYNSTNVKYSSIDKDALSSDEKLQRQILTDYYKSTSRFSEEKINKLVEQSADLGELGEEASSSLDELVQFQQEEEAQAIEKAKEQRDNNIKQQREQLNELKTTLENTDEIIPGVKINPTLKSKIEKNLTTPVAMDENGTPLSKVGKYRTENPLDFEIKLNYIFEATNGFKDFDVFSKSGKRSAYKELEKVSKTLDKQNHGGTSGKSKGDPEVKDSINYFLNQMK